MATTHAKIRQALRQANSRKTWTGVGDLVEAIAKSGSKEFLLDDEPLGAASIRHLVRLMVSLEFLAEDDDGAICVTESARAAASDEKFNRKMQSAVRSYLENHDIPFEQITKAIAGITLPDVPDADTIYATIYDGIDEGRRKVTSDLFRTLMYLYSLADGMERKVRVFYGRE